MAWVVSAIFLLVGGLIQTVQALTSLRQSFQRDVQTEAAVLSQGLDQVDAEVAERLAEETARSLCLQQTMEDFDLANTVRQALEATGQPTTGTDDEVLAAFLAEHRQDLDARVAEMNQEFQPWSDVADARQTRVNQRVDRANATSKEFVESLTKQLKRYRRKRAWIALGWFIIAIGGVFNLIAAIQSA